MSQSFIPAASLLVMLDFSACFGEFPQLTTPRLRLRAPEPGDAGAVLRVMGDPRVVRYFGQLPITTLGEAEARIVGQTQAFAASQGIRWAIADPETNAWLGSAGFWRLLPQHHRAEIGYELAAEHWGHGLMTEALHAIVGFGFAHMHLHSIEANIHPHNIGSRRVLEKLGFVQEGHFIENYFDVVENALTDTVSFSLLARNWR
jgi:[ribosomal protein S5]-alanine N-acetyltransferase